MTLPIAPPVSPMLAKLVRSLPEGGGLAYEPKFDGFRGIVFRDGDAVEIGSRNERPLTRYFPELVEEIRRWFPDRCVVDGEIVIMTASGLDFDLLSLRIHPAASRVARLAAETPAAFIAFDLLALGDDAMLALPFAARRRHLERALQRAEPPVHLAPTTEDPGVARDWFDRFEGAGLDGVVVKAADGPYRPGERGWQKVKHERTADCAVAGFRRHADGAGVGSLLLGLFDDAGTLHHVGVAASFAATRRAELATELEPYRAGALEGHPWSGWLEEAERQGGRMPGGPSRWNARKDLSWEPLRVELVAEVAYEHLQGDRFRHTARYRRWRPDRDPRSCTYAQLEVVVPAELRELFAG